MSLLGTWELVRAESGGEHSSDLIALRVELELTGTHYTVRFGGEIADRGSYAHDAASTPTALAIHGTDGPNAGRTIPCIYQLVGDRLRICYGMDGTAPTGFVSPPGSTHYLATYRRKP